MSAKGSNGAGVRVSREEDLELFDNLPPEFRSVLREAPINVMALSGVDIMRHWSNYEPHELIPALKNAIHASHVDIAEHGWQWAKGPHPFVEDSRNKQRLTYAIWRA